MYTRDLNYEMCHTNHELLQRFVPEQFVWRSNTEQKPCFDRVTKWPTVSSCWKRGLQHLFKNSQKNCVGFALNCRIFTLALNTSSHTRHQLATQKGSWHGRCDTNPNWRNIWTPTVLELYKNGYQSSMVKSSDILVVFECGSWNSCIFLPILNPKNPLSNDLPSWIAIIAAVLGSCWGRGIQGWYHLGRSQASYFMKMGLGGLSPPSWRTCSSNGKCFSIFQVDISNMLNHHICM